MEGKGLRFLFRDSCGAMVGCLSLPLFSTCQRCFFCQMFQGSLNYLFGGDQTMQMYGKFEGFPINSALFGVVI